jgi:hypothetical protein
VGSAGSFGAHAAHRRAVPLVALAWLLVGALSAGCAVELERPTAPPEPTLADATAEAVNEEAALEWIAFREQYELRSDRAWVLSVAGNPLSVNDTGIPLLPYELVELGSVNIRLSELIPAVQAYGPTRPSVYAGTIVHGATVVLLVAGPTDEHEAALRALLPEAHDWEVRSVRWSLASLESFVDIVKAHRPWFEAKGLLVPNTSPDEGRNQVLVDYLAPAEEMGEVIRQRLGDPDWLELRYSGPLPWDGPPGRLEVRVVDEAGEPVEGIYCEAIPVDPTVNAETGDAFNTSAEGICSQPGLPVTRYRIVANQLIEGEPHPLAEVTLTVVADTVTRTSIVVDLP